MLFRLIFLTRLLTQVIRPYLLLTSVGGSLKRMGHFSEWATLAYGAETNLAREPNHVTYQNINLKI